MELNKMDKIKIWHGIRRVLVTFAMLIGIYYLIKIAPNYETDPFHGMTKIIINNNNVTGNLEHEIIIKDDIIYLSKEDITRYFDNNIIINDERIITTSKTKVASIYLKEETDQGLKMNLNGEDTTFETNIMKVDDITYLPLNAFNDIYNIEIKYNEDTNIIAIDSTDRKYVEGTCKKGQFVHSKAVFFSKLIDRVDKDDKFKIVQDEQTGEDVEIGNYVRIRTEDGNIGYILKSNIESSKVIRETPSYRLENNKKVSLVWDYYRPNEVAPTRTEPIQGANVVSPSFYRLNLDGTISVNFGEEGQNYVNWAHNNGYKVWPTVSNNGLNNLDALTQMFSTFESRNKLITSIVNAAESNGVDGVHIDIERMHKSDKDNFSRFIMELAPRLHDKGKTLSVLVTAPYGSDTWSLCYDRHAIGRATDYMVYLAYDDQGVTSSHSIASANIIETNIKSFTEIEGVPKEKLIVAVPFYTRLWKEEAGTVTSSVSNMINIRVPEGIEKVWNDTDKQYYMEYKSGNGNATYKMWIEDKDSIAAKLDIFNKHGLAGAGFWEKDRETQDVWGVIEEKLQ